MRAATISRRFVEPDGIDEVLCVSSDNPLPPKPNKGQLLLRVRACSLAPGDVRVLRGDTSYMQNPRTMPYIPGGDVCGEVVTVDPEAPTRFAIGERVIAMFEPDTPQGGLAQYSLVRTDHCARAPPSVTCVEAAALPSSALTAMMLSKHVRKGDRVLILGASGGVGAHLVQLVKQAGASFIAGTMSKSESLLRDLGVDRPIDYLREQWWEVPELVADPVDVVFDLASGPNGWPRMWEGQAAKPAIRGGRYFTTMPGTARPMVRSGIMFLPDILKLMFGMLLVKAGARLGHRSVPSYNMPALLIPSELTGDKRQPLETNIEALVRRVTAGELKPIIDPAGPFPFTAHGIAQAFQLQGSRHALGKVVIEVL